MAVRTVVRAQLEHESLPWTNTAISGWVLDPDRKKMSKSKGNVVTPMGLLEQYGADAVRYWAASGRPGTDTAFDGADEGGPPPGHEAAERGAFALLQAEPRGAITEPLDRGCSPSWPAGGRTTDTSRPTTTPGRSSGPKRSSGASATTTSSWSRADATATGPEAAASANSAMLVALSTMLRLFAPYLPFVTEEVWSWWQPGSVHRASWPTGAEVLYDIGGADEGRRRCPCLDAGGPCRRPANQGAREAAGQGRHQRKPCCRRPSRPCAPPRATSRPRRTCAISQSGAVATAQVEFEEAAPTSGAPA